MNKQSLLIGLQIILLASSGFTYQVKLGDTLSSIAHQQLEKPVFGSAGSLNKILKMNPQIKNPDLIFIGQELILNEQHLVETDINVSTPNQNSMVVRAPAVETSVTELQNSEATIKISTQIKSTDTEVKNTIPGQVGFNLNSRYLRLDGRDDSNGGATATFYSEISPGVSLFWAQKFSEQWSGMLNIDLYNLQMQKFSKRSFTNDRVNFSSLSYNVGYQFNDSNLVFNFNAGFAQQVFVQSVDVQTLEVLRILTPEVRLGLNWNFFKAGPLSGALLGGVGWIGPGRHSDFSANAGQLYYGGIELNQNLRAGAIHARLQQNRSRQTSDLLGTMDRTQLLFELGYSWDLQ